MPSLGSTHHTRLFIFPTCLQAIAATTLRNNVAGFFSFVCLCVRSCEASDPSRGLGSVQRRLEILQLLQVNHPAQDNKLSRSTGVANAPANLQKVRRPEGRRLHLQWQSWRTQMWLPHKPNGTQMLKVNEAQLMGDILLECTVIKTSL